MSTIVPPTTDNQDPDSCSGCSGWGEVLDGDRPVACPACCPDAYETSGPGDDSVEGRPTSGTSRPPWRTTARPGPEPYYADDSVTLYHGDCLEVADWLTADVLVTDPPYGMSYVSGASRHDGPTTPIAGDQDTSARDAIVSAWGSRPGLVFGTWRSSKPTGTRLTLTWDKGVSPGLGNLTLPWGLSTEEIYVLGDWPPIQPGGRARQGGVPARVASVIRVDTLNSQASARPDHPTPKPLGLMERLIAKCPLGVIADPFAGSGPTLVAAKHLGRRAIGVELDERYCEIAARRLSQDVLDFGGVA